MMMIISGSLFSWQFSSSSSSSVDAAFVFVEGGNLLTWTSSAAALVCVPVGFIRVWRDPKTFVSFQLGRDKRATASCYCRCWPMSITRMRPHWRQFLFSHRVSIWEQPVRSACLHVSHLQEPDLDSMSFKSVFFFFPFFVSIGFFFSISRPVSRYCCCDTNPKIVAS